MKRDITLRLNILLTALLSFAAVSVPAFAEASKVVPDSLGAKQAASHTLAELLEGEVAGVRVSSTGISPLSPVSVDIRGISTLRGDDQPLWIVDGAVIENASGLNLNPFWNYSDLGRVSAINTFFHLSPDDVESIEVLKDASATALYGSRGAAGVIIVKTKRALGREQGVQWKSNAGFAPEGGFLHNHYLDYGMSKRNTTFNSSVSYRSFAIGADGIGANDLSFRSSLETRAAKVMWFGVNFMGGLGSFDNSGKSMADYRDDGKRYGATASACLRFNLFRGLDWTTTAGGDYRSLNRFIWYGTQTPVGAAYNGLAGITNNTALSYNVNSVLNFKRYFAVKQGLEAQAGVDFYGGRNLYNSLAASDYLAEDLKARGISISNGTRPTWLYTETLGHYALFARVGYTFDDIFGLNASYRADKTFTAYDGRFDQYPAGDVWLDLRKLFFKSSNLVSQLSMEGGFGISGNEKNLLYPFLDTAVDARTVPEVEKARRTYINARSLQRLQEWNAGLKAGFLSQRILLEGKYFNRVVNDSFDIFDSAVMDTDGKWKKGTPSLMSARSSAFTARGFELSLSAVVIRTDDVKWTLRGNFTEARTQVVRVDGEDTWFNPGYDGSGYFAANVVGAPVGTIIGYEVGSDGYYKDNVPDGVINGSDCVMLGNLLPEMYGGLGTTLRLYGFTLDLAADYAAAFSVIDGASMRAENRTVLTARYVSRGDYLRLSRAALSYDIPLPECAVKGLSVTLSGHNLFTLSRFGGAYPEASPFGLHPLSRGNDWEGRSLRPSVILGVGVKF